KGVPFVARGAGTGLSGGALARAPAVLVTLTRLSRIFHVDAANRRAVVEPGVVNATLTRAAAPCGLLYAPGPPSRSARALGGAGAAVSRSIAAGIVPAALEMMDQSTVRLVESSMYAAGYPTDAAAVLLVETDGRERAAAAEAAHAEAICREAGARSVRVAT